MRSHRTSRSPPPGRPLTTEQANWAETSAARAPPDSAPRDGSRAAVRSRGLSSARLGLCQSAARACPRQAGSAARRSISPGWASRHAQFGRCAGRGDAGGRTAPDRQQRGRALFRQQAHDRISARLDRCGRGDAARASGRDIGDIDAWLTSWDYPALAGTIARSVLEEMPQSLKLLRTTEAAGFDGRRLDQMTRTPKILGRQLGLAGAGAADLPAAP